MDFDLEKLTAHVTYNLMIGLIAPRPIALVTSRNEGGGLNAAPYSAYNYLCTDSPIVGLGVTDRSGGGFVPKDTARNIRRTGEFVINVVTEDLLDQMNICATDFPAEVSELDMAGLSTTPSKHIQVPRIAQAHAALECVEYQTLEIGRSRIILGKIVAMYIEDRFVDQAGPYVLAEDLHAVGRMNGQGAYVKTRDAFVSLHAFPSNNGRRITRPQSRGGVGSGAMSLFFAAGTPTTEMSPEEVRGNLFAALDNVGPRQRVLIIPPDFTRMHSQSGVLTELTAEFYGSRLADVLPALGTHKPMTDPEIATMFGSTPRNLFRVHNWRTDVVTLGEVPGEFMREVSEGKLDYPWPAQVNRLLRDGGHDLILSIGQVVPHEVVGMANGNKNIFIGTGGAMGIHRSHFLGAVYGMERMMGRADTPVRRVLNYASDHFGSKLPQIVYVQTVVGENAAGKLVIRGMYVGDDAECFEHAASLSLKVNFQMMPREIRKAVVFLDPLEFRSTWLGNKSIYRTRMALADGAELIVLAPGVREFGEDPAIDTLIRKYGYCGTPATLEAVKHDADLAPNLSAAAHLIHGSSEGRFTIRYCPGHLTQHEIEAVHFEYGDLALYTSKYTPALLKDGWNIVDGEEIFYISNPGLGLWAYEGRFKD